MFHLKHRLRIFSYCRKFMFCSQDIQVFVFLTIPCITKSVTSRWVLVHETRCIFEYIFWTKAHKTWSIDSYKQGQKFSGIFSPIWRTGPGFQVLFNLATCSNSSITNYVRIPVFHFFERVNKGQLKMLNANY